MNWQKIRDVYGWIALTVCWVMLGILIGILVKNLDMITKAPCQLCEEINNGNVRCIIAALPKF